MHSLIEQNQIFKNAPQYYGLWPAPYALISTNAADALCST